MKKFGYLNWLITVLMGSSLMFSCKKIEDANTIVPNSTIAKVGNAWTVSAAGFPQASVEVTKNDAGLATAKISMVGLSLFEVKAKITENQITDYVYSGGNENKPFILARFDAQVGDQYMFQTTDGKTIVRTVLANHEEVLAPALGLIVKCVVVEENIPTGQQPLRQNIISSAIPHAKTIKWYVNHRFGFIAADVITEGGQTYYVNLRQTNCDTQNP